MAKGKRKFLYESSQNNLQIIDKRQSTCGPIIPNFLFDLYLPVIGYTGIGIIGLLYRLASRGGRVILNKQKYANAGLIGFRQFRTVLDLLEELKFIKITTPTGADRARHFRTVITLFDAPEKVPVKYVEKVRNLSIAQWLILYPDGQSEVSELPNGNSEFISELPFGNFMELPNGNSMGLPNGNPIMNETSEDKTSEDKTSEHTHTARIRARVGVGKSEFSKKVCREYADMLKAINEGISNPGGYATAIWRTGEADGEIREWLERRSKPTRKPQDCPRCNGSGVYYPQGIASGGPVKKCDHAL